jgi:hypothetical protein
MIDAQEHSPPVSDRRHAGHRPALDATDARASSAEIDCIAHI